MENRKIIISIIVLLFLSLSFLIYRAENMPEPMWWSVYFSNAKDASSNFEIENHTDKTEFKFEILSDGNIVKSENVVVSKGEIKNVDVSLENLGKKITIKVYSGEEKREIYKNN